MRMTRNAAGPETRADAKPLETLARVLGNLCVAGLLFMIASILAVTIVLSSISMYWLTVSMETLAKAVKLQNPADTARSIGRGFVTHYFVSIVAIILSATDAPWLSDNHPTEIDAALFVLANNLIVAMFMVQGFRGCMLLEDLREAVEKAVPPEGEGGAGAGGARESR
jgi:hypothetical protein